MAALDFALKREHGKWELKTEFKWSVGLGTPIAFIAYLAIFQTEHLDRVYFSVHAFVTRHQWPLIIAAVALIVLLLPRALTFFPGSHSKETTDADSEETTAAEPTANGHIQNIARSPLATITLFIAGLLLLATAALLPLYEPTRNSAPRVGVLQSESAPSLDSLLEEQEARLKAITPYQLQIAGTTSVKDKDDLFTRLGRLYNENCDVIIVDVYNPFSQADVARLRKVLNHYTLYVFMYQMDVAVVEAFSNVVSLSPRIADEVLAIAQRIPSNVDAIQIYYSADSPGISADKLLRRLLTPNQRSVTNSRPLKSNEIVDPPDGAIVVLLDWARTPDQVIRGFPIDGGMVIAGSHAEHLQLVSTPAQMLFFGIALSPAPTTLRANQEAILASILSSHFQHGRPLQPADSVERARQNIRSALMGSMSASREVNYRYAELTRNYTR